MQVLKNFPPDEACLTYLRPSVTGRLTILSRSNHYEVRIRKIPLWYSGLSLGIPAFVIAAVVFSRTHNFLIVTVVGIVLVIISTVILSFVLMYNRKIAAMPVLILDRNAKELDLGFDNVTIAFQNILTLHILKGWYHFKGSWKFAQVNELSVIVQKDGLYMRYHVVVGRYHCIRQVAQDLAAEMNVPILEATKRLHQQRGIDSTE